MPAAVVPTVPHLHQCWEEEWKVVGEDHLQEEVALCLQRALEAVAPWVWLVASGLGAEALAPTS